MRLAELLTGIAKDVSASNAEQFADMNVTGVSCDSRRIEPGYVFAALPGTNADGRDYIDNAVSRGAIAVLAADGTRHEYFSKPFALVTDENPRQCYSKMASTFHGAQPGCVAAVTGTNGKTSVVTFVRQIWAALGIKAASAGTLGVQASGDGLDINYPGSLTTPDPTDLHQVMAELAREGVDHMAIEASSHGLDQYRLDGVHIDIAAFTNLTRDHLDYHGDTATYFKAKRRLFSDLLRGGGTVVLNADVPEFSDLKKLADKRNCKVISFGYKATDIVLKSVVPYDNGQQISMSLFGRDVSLEFPLIGSFQVDNAMCALGIVIAAGEGPYRAVETLHFLQGVRGRLELAGTLVNGANVYVDFAHTADALVSALQTMRPHVSGRLVVLFGCGGDRDPGKRIEMGRAACENADYVILSDDNPRSEDPAAIRAQAREGCPDATEIDDRAEAIAFGVVMLEPGDLFVVAGKGHEQGQIIGDEVHPFDDASVVRAAIAQVNS
ncbi:MAG: UDP-N-acetylmuramoyl-L-alanyl-D-glutamate--2,6-diaminopimelate ligase [Rhodospirillales bacterium]|nr:UDP-N-acetylmuramoyl-L-alanyl-D-glutamate--2,6-diaminopimelate ligase [Rhodospirillales bacterium]